MLALKRLGVGQPAERRATSSSTVYSALVAAAAGLLSTPALGDGLGSSPSSERLGTSPSSKRLGTSPSGERLGTSPSEEVSSKVEIRPAIDLPLTVVAAVFASPYLLRHELAPACCAPLCDRSRLNALDRLSAGRWSPTWARLSDAAVGTMLAGITVALAVDRGVEGGADLVLMAEAVLAANALGTLMTTATRRPRPFLYGENAPLDERQDGGAALSLFSGHTAASFAAAVTFSQLLRVRYPRSRAPNVALAVGLTLASFVGLSRVLAGQHHPTDVLLGAAVGSSLGVLIPVLHKSR